MEVEAGAATVRFTTDAVARVLVLEPARSMRLVRRLVLREPHVTVDAEDRTFRVAHELRRELSESHVELLDQELQRVEDFVVVGLAVRLEPLTLVVLLQLAQEGERAAPEAAESISHLIPNP